MLWGASSLALYIPWAGHGGPYLGVCLWLWLGVLDAIQSVALGLILLQTLCRLHVCATLAFAQVIGSISVIVAPATAPTRMGAESVFPDAAQSDFADGLKDSPLASPLFWIALVCRLIIVIGYFWFYRLLKETLPICPLSNRILRELRTGEQCRPGCEVRPTSTKNGQSSLLIAGCLRSRSSAAVITSPTSLLKNQCIFTHYYKPKKTRLWPAISLHAAASPHELPDDPGDEGGDTQATRNQWNNEVDTEEVPPSSTVRRRYLTPLHVLTSHFQPFDPVECLLDYILEVRALLHDLLRHLLIGLYRTPRPKSPSAAIATSSPCSACVYCFSCLLLLTAHASGRAI